MSPPTLYRHWEKPDYAPDTVVLTHGLMMRRLCMRWFHRTVEYFESLNNPYNAGVHTLVRQEDGRYVLGPPFSQWLERTPKDTVLTTTPRYS